MTFDELRIQIAQNHHFALYLTHPGCAPCTAVRPWAEALFQADPDWVWTAIETPDSPDIAGQLLVFSHPTLLLFVEGKEFARFSRIIRQSEVTRAKEAAHH